MEVETFNCEACERKNVERKVIKKDEVKTIARIYATNKILKKYKKEYEEIKFKRETEVSKLYKDNKKYDRLCMYCRKSVRQSERERGVREKKIQDYKDKIRKLEDEREI